MLPLCQEGLAKFRQNFQHQGVVFVQPLGFPLHFFGRIYFRYKDPEPLNFTKFGAISGREWRFDGEKQG